MGSMPGPKNPKAERARIGYVPPRLPPGESKESPAATEQRCEGGGLGFAEARRRGGWRMRKDGWIGGAAPCGWVGDRAEKQSKVLKWQPPFTALENLACFARPTKHYIIYGTSFFLHLLDYPRSQQWEARYKSQLSQNSSSEGREYIFLYVLIHEKFKDITI